MILTMIVGDTLTNKVEIMIEWKRKGSAHELFVEGNRKGIVVCKHDAKHNSVFVAYQGGKLLKQYASLYGAKMSVEAAVRVGVDTDPKCDKFTLEALKLE